MRIPLAYLAELFAAGNTAVVERVLQKLLDMRSFMKTRELGESSGRLASGCSDEEYLAMYRLLAVAKYRERFLIPAGSQQPRAEKQKLQGCGGFSCGGGC